MTDMLGILSSDCMHRLGWTLLHSVWQFALLALLLALILAALRRRSANLRYATACAGLAVMLALSLTTYCLVPGHAACDLPAARILPGDVPNLSGNVMSPSMAPPAHGARVSRRFAGPAQGHSAAPSASPAPQEGNSHEAVAGLVWQILQALSPWMPWLAVAWFAGAMALSIWHLGGWVAVQRMRFLGTSGAVGPLGEQLAGLAGRMKISRPVRLLRSTVVEVPVVVGWLRPVILIPAAMLTGLSPSQLTAVLAHELAHVRRYDYLVNLLQAVVETLLFYHPAVWWLSRRIRAEREHCCDDMAIAVCGSKVEYASVLAALETSRSAPAMALAASGSSRCGPTLQRVRRVLCETAGDQTGPRIWLGGVLTMVMMTAAGVSVAFSLAGGPHESDHVTKIESAPPKEDLKRPALPVWMALMVKSPIRSLQEYQHAVRTEPPPQPPLFKPLPIPKCDFEIRRAKDQSRIARIPYDGYLRESRELNKGDRSRIGRLPGGKYLVALCIGDARCSNVAAFEVDSDYDPTKEKALRVEAIEPGPRQSLRYVGVRVTGPMIEETIFTTLLVCFPDLIVDGTARRLDGLMAGSFFHLPPGTQSYGLVDLAQYTPAIAADKAHTVRAVSGKYQSDPARISLHQPLGRAWDRATASLPPTADTDGSPEGVAMSTAWGAPRDGLRAGIRLLEAGSDVRVGTIRVGDKARPVCVVHNVSNRTIKFTTFKPVLLSPMIRDTRGRLVNLWTPPWDGPVQPVSHTLAPGKVFSLGVSECLFAPNPDPLIDQAGQYTARVQVGEGKYKMSCEIDLPSQKPGDWSGRLKTGQLDLEVLPPDREKLTERVASTLRRGADHFALKVFYSGSEKPPLRSLRLNHDGIAETFPPTWTTVDIDRKQVNAILEGLARQGYLWRIVADSRDKLASADPQYVLSIDLGNELAARDPEHRLRSYPISLGWTPAVREELQRLRKVLEGQAATALDQLIAQPRLQDFDR